jgi:aspartate/methionine/tyrosine aminotransferase
MVTSGANQAFVNVVLALCDASDRVVLFVPYYFNHIMALQMTGGAPQVG